MRVAPSGSGGAPPPERLYVSDCERKRVRVYVDGVEVPTVDSSAEDDQYAVEVQLRKDGPGAISKLSDVYVPAMWKGQNVWQALPFGDEEETVPVHIEARALEDEDYDWETLHYGWLRKIGSGGDGRLLRFRVDDYAKMLQGEYVSGSFETQSRTLVSDVAEKVQSSLQAKGMDFGFVDEAGLTVDTEEEDEDAPEGAQEAIQQAQEARQSTSSVIRHFESDRDTLIDVLDWAVEQEEDVYWYIDYDGERPVITITDGEWTTYMGGSVMQDNTEWDSWDETDEFVTIRKNLALQDLNPVNTLIARGRTGVSIAGFEVPGGSLISDEYPVAVVQHDGLVTRANGVAHERQEEVDAITIDGAKNKAKSLIVDEIGGAGESSMILNGTPGIVPFDDIYAVPVCNQYVEGDVPEMKFGIERVVHKLPATDQYTTEIFTNVSVNKEDISVDWARTTMASTKGTEESGDEVTSFGRTGSGFGIT